MISNTLVPSIHAIIKNYELDNKAFVIAYSGGLDSSVLLHALSKIAKIRIRAVHIHHGLQADADRWAMHCEHQCQEWNIPYDVIRVNVERESGTGLESAARKARYQAFAASMKNDEVLLTAHHQNDQAETILLRLLRASGSQGLSGMQAFSTSNGIPQLRPLLTITREELLAYAQQHALTWIEDPSNENTQFDRNYLRQHIMPSLQSRWPHSVQALSHSAMLLREEQQCLQDQAALYLANMQTIDANIIDATHLSVLTPAWRAQVLRYWVNSLQLAPLPGSVLEQIQDELLFTAPDDEAMVRWEQACIRRWRDYLFCGPFITPPDADWRHLWTDLNPVRLSDDSYWGWLSSAHPIATTFDDVKAYFGGPLHIGYRQGGEKIQLAKREHRSHLKQCLQDIGIPPWERQLLPMLINNAGECLGFADIIVSEKLAQFQNDTGLRFTRLNATEALSFQHSPLTPGI